MNLAQYMDFNICETSTRLMGVLQEFQKPDFVSLKIGKTIAVRSGVHQLDSRFSLTYLQDLTILETGWAFWDTSDLSQ